MQNNNKVITTFYAVDPVGLVQEAITNDDPEVLQQAAEMGISFVAEYIDGSRQVVPWQDVNLSKIGMQNTIYVVMQEHFVPVLESLVELMDTSMTPAVQLLSLTPQKNEVNDRFANFKEKAESLIDMYKSNIETDDEGEDR